MDYQNKILNPAIAPPLKGFASVQTHLEMGFRQEAKKDTHYQKVQGKKRSFFFKT